MLRFIALGAQRSAPTRRAAPGRSATPPTRRRGSARARCARRRCSTSSGPATCRPNSAHRRRDDGRARVPDHQRVDASSATSTSCSALVSSTASATSTPTTRALLALAADAAALVAELNLRAGRRPAAAPPTAGADRQARAGHDRPRHRRRQAQPRLRRAAAGDGRARVPRPEIRDRAMYLIDHCRRLATRLPAARLRPLALAGTAAPWALNLAAMGEAARGRRAADYKALVCVFLYGGNDYANTLVPYDAPSYALYQGMRADARVSRRPRWPPTLLSADRRAAERPPVRARARAGAAAAACSTPASWRVHAQRRHAGAADRRKAQYTSASRCRCRPSCSRTTTSSRSGSRRRPRARRRAGAAASATCSLSGNGNATFTCVNVSGNAVFLSGDQAVQYQVSAERRRWRSAASSTPLFGSTACSAALRALVTGAAHAPVRERIQRA